MRFFSTQGLEISKQYFYEFHLISAKHHEDIVYHGEYMLLLLLAIGQILKLLWHFEILT